MIIVPFLIFMYIDCWASLMIRLICFLEELQLSKSFLLPISLYLGRVFNILPVGYNCAQQAVFSELCGTRSFINLHMGFHRLLVFHLYLHPHLCLVSHVHSHVWLNLLQQSAFIWMQVIVSYTHFHVILLFISQTSTLPSEASPVLWFCESNTPLSELSSLLH